MTAIAASKDPQALALFRQILIASAAVPGVFPPVMIDVTVNGVRHQEMHVNGGASAQVFAYPPSVRPAEHAASLGVDRGRAVYVILNARLNPGWTSVQRQSLTIATRAISSLMRSQAVGDLYRIYLTSRRDEVDYNLALIPTTFTKRPKKQFDTDYMRSLYQTGYDLSATGFPWRKAPPGYEAPPAIVGR